jgi:hypothetical protein
MFWGRFKNPNSPNWENEFNWILSKMPCGDKSN